MTNPMSQEEVVKEHLINTNNLIKDLSRNLNLNPERLVYIEKHFEKSIEEMSIKDLALLNEMQIGTCLDQIA